MQHGQRGKIGTLLTTRAATAGETITAQLDTAGYRYALVSVNMSARQTASSGSSTISIGQSDSTQTFATIVADVTKTNASAHTHTVAIDLKGKKRYLQLTFNTSTVANSGLSVGATAILFRGESGPASTSDMILTTNDVAALVV